MKFPNMAGKHNIDDVLAQELEAAGIRVLRLQSLKDGRKEVNTAVRGECCGWSFARAWYYWIAEGPGIPPVYADRLYEQQPRSVRADGHAGCLSPRELKKGFACDFYHIDTPDGLKALADMLKEIVEVNSQRLKP